MIRRRWADILFVLASLSAVAFYMYLASGFSFWNDGWGFIRSAEDWSLDWFMRPHNEHWQLLNKLVHKALITTVGLRSYVPYQLIAILLHIAIAAGIYTYARRHVPALVALAIGVVFLFLGIGAEDYFMAFQMGYNFAAAAGLWALVILMREPEPRHARLAALLLVLGVMSMGVALFFLAAAAAVIIVSPSRRHLWWVVAPAIVIYGAWYALYGSDAVGGGLVTQYAVTGLARADTLPDSFMAGRYVHIAAIFILIALIGLLDGRTLARPGERFRLVLAGGAVAGIALWWNVSRAFVIQDRWEANIDQTRASISLLLEYGGTPAVPDDRGLRLVPGGEVRAVAEGERHLIPGSAELTRLFARFGSPLEDPLAVRGVAIPPRIMDKAFGDLVVDSLVVTSGDVPPTLSPIDVLSVEAVETTPDGACLIVEALDDGARVRLSLPSAASLYIDTDLAGLAEMVLSLNGSFSGVARAVDLEPGLTTQVQLPDIGVDATMLLEVRHPGGGSLRLCQGAAQPV